MSIPTTFKEWVSRFKDTKFGNDIEKIHIEFVIKESELRSQKLKKMEQSTTRRGALVQDSYVAFAMDGTQRIRDAVKGAMRDVEYLDVKDTEKTGVGRKLLVAYEKCLQAELKQVRQAREKKDIERRAAQRSDASQGEAAAQGDGVAQDNGASPSNSAPHRNAASQARSGTPEGGSDTSQGNRTSHNGSGAPEGGSGTTQGNGVSQEGSGAPEGDNGMAPGSSTSKERSSTPEEDSGKAQGSGPELGGDA
ncbi:hypothetical protein BDZ45DRAFT_91990 [Acephala macrosclerotiorum]|nr:hypothetical protein BDZ45DRAFT_91990 [Acephala macrosclerotiorum]